MEKANNKLVKPKAKKNIEPLMISKDNIRDYLYFVRGEVVMLDSDLARYYGYTTKAFNQQVKNNIKRFDEDFMFELTKEETVEISRSKKLTMNGKIERGTNYKYMPHVFTERGVYMLMTVLKGELAIEQSKKLIRLFKSMKDFILNLSENAFISETTPYIEERFNKFEKKQSNQDKKIKKISDRLDLLMFNFNDPIKLKQFVIKNGERIEADLAYKEIYSFSIFDYKLLKFYWIIEIEHQQI